MDEKERITMMNNLKLKWADTNARYQRLSVALDLESQKRMKEMYSTILLGTGTTLLNVVLIEKAKFVSV